VFESVARPSGAVRYEDDLGEFEIRLLFEQHLGDDSAAARLAEGWDGDRYLVLRTGARTGADVLVWYVLWDDRAAATRFAKALGRAWAKRRAGGHGLRRSEIKQLLVSGVQVVRLVDAPPRWVGWKHVPAIRVTRAGR